MKILALDHVALPVKNLEESCWFYENILELKPIERPAFDFPGAWYRLGTSQELHLLCREKPEGIPRNSVDRHFALRIDEPEEIWQRLDSNNLDYEGPKNRPDGIKQLFLRDPDGHSIELFWTV